MPPLALTGSLNVVKNARLACQDRLSVRAAAHTFTVLLYIIYEATQNEKVSRTKLYTVPIYPHTKMCEDSFKIFVNTYNAYDLINLFYAERENILRRPRASYVLK